MTVASYTWTLLRELVEAPPHPGERHHPVRLFIGSGMPRGLWRRVERRFEPARVLEFYASTEAGAILVNLRAAKRGSMGRPLPGSSEVRIAAYDIGADQLVLGPDGFARERGPDEIGMLLVRVDANEQLSIAPAARDLLAPRTRGCRPVTCSCATPTATTGESTGSATSSAAAQRPIFTTPIRDALMDLPAVDLAVAYGVAPDGATSELAIAAVHAARGR